MESNDGVLPGVTKRAKRMSSSNEASDLNKETQRPSDRASLVNKLNQEIVHMLQDDGRRPYKEIAEALNVSEGTIRNRVNWMRDAGMLQIAAISDPSSFNYQTDSMLGVKVAAHSTPKDVAARLSEHQEVVFILWVTGRYDLIVEIVSDAEDILCNFLENHCFNQTDITSVEVMKSLATYKNQFLLKRDVP
ncbi:MAG: AsnC family transcriptional regulator [Pseudomonadales bacterium]